MMTKKTLTELANTTSVCDDYDPNSMPVEQAREYIKAFLRPVEETERVHLHAALGRVLAEGFKHEAIPKIEVHRAAFGTPLLASEDANIIAIATDTPLQISIPQIDLNDINAIAAFIHTWLKK